jgi:hypothetical protein
VDKIAANAPQADRVLATGDDAVVMMIFLEPPVPAGNRKIEALTPEVVGAMKRGRGATGVTVDPLAPHQDGGVTWIRFRTAWTLGNEPFASWMALCFTERGSVTCEVFTAAAEAARREREALQALAGVKVSPQK